MSVESNFLLGGCRMTYSFWLGCQQIILKNIGLQSTVQTWSPLQGWITGDNGFMFKMEMIFQRTRSRDINWFSQGYQNDTLSSVKSTAELHPPTLCLHHRPDFFPDFSLANIWWALLPSLRKLQGRSHFWWQATSVWYANNRQVIVLIRNIQRTTF